MEKKFCSNCGSELQENARFCQKCGTPTSTRVDSSYQKEGEPKTNRKSLYALLAVVAALLLIICGAIYYSDFQENREIRQAREQFVKDSLEQVRQDSIKLAEQKEKERLEAEKVAKFREQLSFENFLGMLKHYENTSYANKCGLNLIYKNVDIEEWGECIEMVNGYDVEKGGKKEYGGYEIIAKSNHACYFIHEICTSEGARLSFKDEEDAKVFYNKAKDYGLIKYGDTYYIPVKKLPNGKSISVEEIDYEKIIGTISSPTYDEGWYVVNFGLDG